MLTIPAIKKLKGKRKIVMLTAYDYLMATYLEQELEADEYESGAEYLLHRKLERIEFRCNLPAHFIESALVVVRDRAVDDLSNNEVVPDSPGLLDRLLHNRDGVCCVFRGAHCVEHHAVTDLAGQAQTRCAGRWDEDRESMTKWFYFRVVGKP